MVAGVVTGVFLAVVSTLPTRSSWFLPTLLGMVIGAVLGALLGVDLLQTSRGRRLLAREEGRLREKFSGELHSGRRWLQFYYEGEDISPYVAQVLYFIESEGRFDSVRAALISPKQPREQAPHSRRARWTCSTAWRRRRMW